MNFKQIGQIMRLTTVILMATLMQVSAAGFAQKISLSRSNTPLKAILKELKQQSGYIFLYSDNVLKRARPVDIKVSQEEFGAVLEEIFANQPLTYSINKNTITIKEKAPSFLDKLVSAFVDIDVWGRVVDEKGVPLVGASVIVKGMNKATKTDSEGRFSLTGVEENAVLVISFIGYETMEITAKADLSDVKMKMGSGELEEVEVLLNTGYQQLPKERATGSFVHIDNELLNRRVSTNIIDRLEDVTSGLILNRTGDVGRDPISIRGRSTLGRFSQPLVVLDNFPYDGSLEDINPNDVASITVLRDAAAASIWGARAGNGVIVITTKSGVPNQDMQVSLVANANWIEQPDPFLAPKLSVTDYIEVEQSLFATGYYNNTISNASNPAYTPVVETLYEQQQGMIDAVEANARIAGYKNQDLRNDLNRYLYRPQLNQQYSLGISGGMNSYRYRVALGYDDQSLSVVGNSSDRLTFNVKNDFRALKDKLGIEFGFYGTKNQRTNQNAGPGDLFFTSLQDMYPYARLVDETGNPASLNRRFSNTFKAYAEEQGLLDWAYKPLNEIGKSPTRNKLDDWRANLGLDYQLIKGLHAKVLYQYWQQNSSTDTKYSQDSYYAREQINLFTDFDQNGNLIRNIPLGGIWNQAGSFSKSHSLRGTMNYSLSWNQKWELDALAGSELKSMDFENSSSRYYGYDPERASIQPVNYLERFSQFINPALTALIPNREGVGGGADRFYSFFANASLSYANRYLFTLSARKDASNLFGVATNQKSVPLWSAGFGWTLSEEGFYNWEQIPFFKLRLSFGYNGNVDRSLSAFTTAQVITNNYLTQLPYAQIINPPNRNLRWEKIKIANFGLDLESKNGRLSGALEFYLKDGLDLIGKTPYAPTSGIQVFTGNTASTRTKGYDLMLNTKNLVGAFQWTSVLLFSGLQEEVAVYENDPIVSSLLSYGDAGQGGTYFPVIGRPLFGVYSLPWAGLNPQTGAPIGYLNGQESEDHRAILNDATLDNVIYHGPARPTVFGSFRNTFSYKGFNLSANISYRFGYFFKRNSVQYGPLLMARGGHADYAQRWKKTGDELVTEVPSMPAARDTFRDRFYANSEILVEKGDHLRFQDIRLGYGLLRSHQGILGGVRKAEVFLYANNLGILWKATDSYLDPDFGWEKPRISLAIGLQIEL